MFLNVYFTGQFAGKGVLWFKRVRFLSPLQFKNGDLGHNAYPARIADKAKPAVDVEVAVIVLIQAGPLMVNILYGAPFEPVEVYAKLHTVRMPGKGKVGFHGVMYYFGLPVCGVVAHEDVKRRIFKPCEGFFEVAVFGEAGYGAPIFRAGQANRLTVFMDKAVFIPQQFPAKLLVQLNEVLPVLRLGFVTFPLVVVAVVVVAGRGKDAHRRLNLFQRIYKRVCLFGHAVHNVAGKEDEVGFFGHYHLHGMLHGRHTGKAARVYVRYLQYAEAVKRFGKVGEIKALPAHPVSVWPANKAVSKAGKRDGGDNECGRTQEDTAADRLVAWFCRNGFGAGQFHHYPSAKPNDIIDEQKGEDEYFRDVNDHDGDGQVGTEGFGPGREFVNVTCCNSEYRNKSNEPENEIYPPFNIVGTTGSDGFYSLEDIQVDDSNYQYEDQWHR